MNDVSRILQLVQSGEAHAAEQLLPLVYEELRRLAQAKLLHESPGQTLQATALVHEAYLRLVGNDRESADGQHWNGRVHFFAAAAEAMRRILVENARRKKRLKRGGDLQQVEFTEDLVVMPEVREDLVALDEALDRLQGVDAEAVRLVHLRYFGGLSIPEAAELMGIAPRTADRIWAFARAWLNREITAADAE